MTNEEELLAKKQRKEYFDEHAGNRVNSLHELIDAAKSRRSVFMERGMFERPTSAAWVANMSGTMIYNLLGRGLYLYEKTKGK